MSKSTNTYTRIDRKGSVITTQPNGSSSTVYLTGTPFLITAASNATGPDVPGFRYKLAKKISAVSTYSGVKQTAVLEEKPFKIHRKSKTSNAHTLEIMSGKFAEAMPNPIGFGTPPVYNTKANDLAVGDLYSSVRDARSQFKGMTFLAELTETLALVRFKGSSIVKLVKQYSSESKKIQKTANKTKRLAQLSDAYLEYTFGWVPLIYDMRDLGRTISSLSRQMPTIRVHAKGIYSHATTSNSVGDFSLVTSESLGKYRYESEARSETYYTGGLYLPSPAKENLGEMFGFTPEEFVPTLVEIFPFSFLLDYFSNFSDVVNAHSTYEPKFSYLSRSDRTVSDRKWHITSAGATLRHSDNSLISASGETSLNLVSTNLSRSPAGGLIDPGFVVENPTVKHIANMAALISTLTRLL